MNRMDRRQFLTLAGAGSLAAVTGTARATTGAEAAAEDRRVTTFRAVAGMPSRPFPAYASCVFEGHVDIERQTGVVTRTVFAGAPETMSTIALPGLTRSLRVTAARERGSHLYIKGVIDDRSQLGAGERPEVYLHLDRGRKVASARVFDEAIRLRLEA